MADRLNGYRILILETREEAQFSRLLAEQGADVLQCPMFTIHDAPDTAPIEAWIGRIVDGEHRALQHIGALFRQQAGKLRLLAGFQNQNAIAVQSVRHDLLWIALLYDLALTPIARGLFILMPQAGLAQGRRG